MTNAETPPLTDAYHKARRQYGLFAGLLLAWELIGIRLTEEPLTQLKVTLKSPEAAPFVLIALVAYFAFRTSIEWFQCDPDRRSLRVSRIDISVAHGLGLGAVTLYAIQRLGDFQVIDSIGAEPSLEFFAGAFAGFLPIHAFAIWRAKRLGEKPWMRKRDVPPSALAQVVYFFNWAFANFLSALCAVYLAIRFAAGTLSYPHSLIGLLFGASVSYAFIVVIVRRDQDRLSSGINRRRS